MEWTKKLCTRTHIRSVRAPGSVSQPVRSPWALNPPTRTSKPEFFDTPDTARMPAPTTTTAKLYAQRSPAKAAGTRLLIPDYFIRRAGKTIIDAANEGLRQRVLRGKASDQVE